MTVVNLEQGSIRRGEGEEGAEPSQHTINLDITGTHLHAPVWGVHLLLCVRGPDRFPFACPWVCVGALELPVEALQGEGSGLLLALA